MEILRARGVEFDVIEYLHHPPDEAQLRRFLELLGCDPREMIHPGSFEELGLDLDDYASADALVALLLEHPGVMQRPICVRGDRAVIARPEERVEEILD